jgi:hypothetical protein
MPMRRGREAVGLAALAALLLTIALGLEPSPAGAAETAKLRVAFSPYRLGRSTTLKIALRVGVQGVSEGVPAPVRRFDMRIPPNLELIGSSLGLAICRVATLLAVGSQGCSPNARLGFGSAQIVVPVGPEPVREAASITAEMGPPVGEDIGVLLYAEAVTPVSAQLIFPGALADEAGTNGQSLSTSVPPIPSLPQAPDVSLTSLNLSLGPDGLTYYENVHGRRVGYRPEGIALPARCPHGGFRFAAEIAFADGTMARASSTVPCRSPRRAGSSGKRSRRGPAGSP